MAYRKSSMNILSLLNTLLALFYSLKGGSAIRCKEDDNELWSYKGRTNGPSAWGERYEDCYGRSQSPIDIKFGTVQKDSNLKPLEMINYDRAVTEAEVINNGHTVMITPKDKVDRTISVNGDTYHLAQLHFHWGSHYDVGTEHLFNSKGYAMEAHFVHTNNAGDLAVVGVLFQEAHTNNTGFKPISEVLPLIRFKTEQTELKSNLNLSKLLPRLPLRFFRYSGSLTTPGCTEGVTWSVAQDIARIGTNQLNEFRSLFSVTREDDHAGCHLQDNFRPVQPLYGRTVTAST